jgi:hypothetical protein
MEGRDLALSGESFADVGEPNHLLAMMSYRNGRVHAPMKIQ